MIAFFAALAAATALAVFMTERVDRPRRRRTDQAPTPGHPAPGQPTPGHPVAGRA